jgi:hypothetical protein
VSRQTTIAQEVRAECRRCRIPFDVVRDIKLAIQDGERNERQRENEVRQVAWAEAVTRGSWPFWRFGFRGRWGEEYDNHDQTVVPRYDEIQQVVGSQFPEYSGPGGEDRLWTLLFSEYKRLTPPSELWWKAFRTAKRQRKHRRAALEQVDAGEF